MIPVFLSSYGRSGTTILMRILAAHPEVLVRSIFPYETRAAQYHFLCAAQGRQSPDFMPVELLGTVFKPFQENDKRSLEWCQLGQTSEYATFGENAIEEYYDFVKGVECKSDAKYFVEKIFSMPLTKEMMKGLSGARSIVLHRDPRDIFCSVKAFNKKRLRLSFGEDMGDQFLYKSILKFQLGESLFKKTFGDQVILFKYEDLLMQMEGTLTNLFEWLRVDSSKDQVDAVIKSALAHDDRMASHKTSGEGMSIGKWRKEASEDNLHMFTEYMKELRLLGYA